MKKKICIECKQEKPVTEFRRANENSDGRLNKCKDCQKERYAQDKLKQAEYAKNYFSF